ncbi:MAG: GNAT family N-acetyltransferase [Chitinophagaceae bacterium]|nr:GNAT family N-acetyltransferase [Chitinophagaceae bacterium]
MLSFKKAGTNDIPLIRELTFQIWPVAYQSILSPKQMEYMLEMMYSVPSLEQQITILKHRFIIGYNGEKPVAFASYSPQLPEEGIYRLHKIYILPAIQGKGAGKAMINHIISDISQNGGKVLELNVNRFNNAKSFYEKMGFAIYRTEDNDIGNGYFMNDYVMRKLL